MDRKIAVMSLVVSVGALAMATFTYSQSGNKAQSLIQQREQQLIRHLLPRVEAIYQDFNLAFPAEPPTSLEQLIDPMLRMIGPVTDEAG